MATSYPTGLDTFTAIGATDEMNDEVGTRTHSEMHNDANDAIEAIEAELGTSPSGSYDTVAARLAASDPSALLVKANNLSDLASASTARTNLGLGTMATATATDYLTKAGNLSGIADAAVARTNLGLGSMATESASAYALLSGANTFTRGQLVVGSANEVQGRFQVVAGQSANAVTVENSSASVLASISAAGHGTFAGLRVPASQSIYLGSIGNSEERIFATNTRFGYSAAYRAIMLGSSSTASSGTLAAATISFGYDPSINASGSFNGDGGEVIFRNGMYFKVPNATDDDWMKVQQLNVGNVTTRVQHFVDGSSDVIQSRVQGHSTQTANLQTWENSSATVLASISAAGLHRWNSAGNEQSTVGAAGGASALPGAPTKYLKVVDSSGATLVIPAYAAA